SHPGRSVPKMIGVVMAIDIGQQLNRHTEITRRIPDIHSVLHAPGYAGVAKDVRNNVTAQTAVSDQFTERLANVLHGPTIEFHREGLPGLVPASHVASRGVGSGIAGC